MKLILFRALMVALLSLFSTTTQLLAQDDRLLGEWTPSNIPLTPPFGTNLVISKSGSNYIASATQSFAVATPNNCTVNTSDTLLSLTPISSIKYQATFFNLTPTSCTLSPLDSIDLEIVFTPDNKRFIACPKSAICSGWVRVGEPPQLIGTKSVPATPVAVGGKGSINVSWVTQPGATSYRITVRGPVTATKTVRSGTATKFSKLPKGSYSVVLSAIFKDSVGKLSTTRPSKAAKATVLK